MELTIEQQRAIAMANARLRLQNAGPAPATTPVDVRGEGGGRGTSLEAALIGARQGVTLGFGDEINAGVRAAGDWFGGKPFGEAYDQRLTHERALLDQTRTENPKATLGGEIGGSMLVPVPGVGPSATVGGAVARGAATGAVTGAISGAGNADGQDMTAGAAKGAVGGGLFGAGAGTAIGIGTKGFRALMGSATRKPTVEGLRAAKNMAYKAVDDAGEMFQPAELQGMAKAAREAVEGAGTYVPDVDAQTTASLGLLERNSQVPMTLGQVDKLRQNLWKRYNAAPNENGILDAIDQIDTLVQSRASSSELMDAARLANGTYKKAELLESAFKKARDQTASTGSGGNILNKYKQAVTRIINDPKRAKWFSSDELATMQKVIDGNLSENALRRIGKLSPSGNGLMMFLNLMGGATMGPGFLPITAAGAVAKEIADRGAAGNVDALMGKVMGAGQAPKMIPGPSAVPGYLGGDFFSK